MKNSESEFNEKPKSSLVKVLDIISTMASRPSGFIGLTILIFHVTLAITSPWFAPYDYKAINPSLMFIDDESVELNVILCKDIYCNERINVNGSDIRNVPANGEAIFYVEMNFKNIDVGKYFVQIYFTDIPRIDSSDLMSCVDLVPGQTECTMEAQTLAPGTDTDQPILGYAIGIFLIIIILYIISRSTRRPGAPF